MLYLFLVLLMALMGRTVCGLLSAADFTSTTGSSQYYVSGNPLGIAFDLP
jgi:hypothetical protein